jgi:hypothetical protein
MKADWPFVVGCVMVDEGVKEGDVGQAGRRVEGSRSHKVMARHVGDGK